MERTPISTPAPERLTLIVEVRRSSRGMLIRHGNGAVWESELASLGRVGCGGAGRPFVALYQATASVIGSNDRKRPAKPGGYRKAVRVCEHVCVIVSLETNVGKAMCDTANKSFRMQLKTSCMMVPREDGTGIRWFRSWLD